MSKTGLKDVHTCFDKHPHKKIFSYNHRSFRVAIEAAGNMKRKYEKYTSNSSLCCSSFLASDLELLCTSKITAAPAT